MDSQMKIDLRELRIIRDEKKLASISFRIGEEFKSDLEKIAKKRSISISDLCTEYVINGFTEDWKTSKLIELYSKPGK